MLIKGRFSLTSQGLEKRPFLIFLAPSDGQQVFDGALC